jgi:tryptophanase
VPTRTGIEPFQIITVEPLCWTTREEREPILARAHHNVVLIPSDEILINPAAGLHPESHGLSG